MSWPFWHFRCWCSSGFTPRAALFRSSRDKKTRSGVGEWQGKEGPGKLKLLLSFNVSLQKQIRTWLADRALSVSYLDIFGFQMALIGRIVVVPRKQRQAAGIEPAPCGSHRHILLSPMTGLVQPVDKHVNCGDKMVTFSPDITTGETSWTACHPGLCWSVRFRCPSGRRVESSVGGNHTFVCTCPPCGDSYSVDVTKRRGSGCCPASLSPDEGAIKQKEHVCDSPVVAGTFGVELKAVKRRCCLQMCFWYF